MKFADQRDAANKLLELLPKDELKANNFLILCLSLKSVIMCDAIARGLDLDYEILFSEDIKAPNNDECDIACVSESEDVVINEALRSSFEITKDFIYIKNLFLIICFYVNLHCLLLAFVVVDRVGYLLVF